jgi:hypothetical protein
VSISKCGYLSVDAESVIEGRRFLILTYVDTGIVDVNDVVNGVHVLSPSFVADQIERSRRNLGLETIDLYLLEDPELTLAGCGPTLFRDRLVRLFETLEAAVARGAIAAYGLATWHGLLLPYWERGHLSIMDVFQTAVDVGGPDHHLRGIALPYNVALGEAKGLESQFGPDSTPLAVRHAARHGHGRVHRSRWCRAATPTPPFFRQASALTTDAQRCLQFARSTQG